MEVQNDLPFLTDGRNNYILEPNKVFTIGRALGNSLTIEDLKISRTHCTLKEENGMWCIIDRSANGTLVNNDRLQKASKILSDRDKIQLSESSQLEFHDARANIEDEISICGAVEEVSRNLRPQAPQDNFKVTPIINIVRPGNQQTTTCKHESLSSSSTSNTVHQLPEDSAAGPSRTKQEEDMENEMMCSICAELFVKAQTLNCSHTFCKKCINQWKKKNKICPICRAKIKTITPTLVLDNLIDKMMETSPLDVQQHRKQLVEERIKEDKPRRAEIAARRGRRGNSVPVVHRTSDVLLISSDDDDDDDDMDPYEFFMMDGDLLDDDTDDMDYGDGGEVDMEYVAGEPGAYYGGYGSCFNCGARGHWSVGCPLR